MKYIITLIIASLLNIAAASTLNLGPIWFVGDSITQSNADNDNNGSPRKSLYDKLTAAGHSFSYTGHHTLNVDGLPTTGSTAATNLYQYHSGVSGSTIGANNITPARVNMTASIPTWWVSGRLAAFKPEIVLIMLGTNDTDRDQDLANAPGRIATLIDTILAQPGANNPAFFVAQITPNLVAAENPRVLDFNAALPGVVNTLKSQGKDVTLVDMYTPINANTAGLMKDPLHTNAAGNDVLAQQWFDAIEAHAVPEPSSTALLGLGFCLALTVRRRS